MAYRKLTADKIFTGAALLEHKVLICAEGGSIIDIANTEDAGDGIETLQGWLCPGFVNTHCHLELSHMQGLIPEQSGMVDFVLQIMQQRFATADVKEQAMQAADAAMQANGIVAVGDICNGTDSLATKTSSKIYYHNFIEVSGFVPATADKRLAAGIDTALQFGQHFGSTQISITPHAPYSVSEKLFELIASHSNGLLSVHSQESVAEDELIRHKKGDMLSVYNAIGASVEHFNAQHTSSLQYMLPLLPPETQIILVHNCHTHAEDLQAIAQKNKQQSLHFMTLCPNANEYIGNPLPNINLLIESGLPLCIGTDSLASNQQLSILAELSTLQQNFPFLSSEQLLHWATLQGAKALKIDDRFGSFEKGKQPGVLLLKEISETNIDKAVVTRIV